MELIKDYDCTIEYHLGKANIVVDALSRKPLMSLSHLKLVRVPLLFDLRATRVNLSVDNVCGALTLLEFLDITSAIRNRFKMHLI